MIKVAIFGYGYLGKWHVEKAIALDSCHFVGAVDSNIKAQKRFKEKYPNHKIVFYFDEIINEIDAAIIVTPTTSHFKLLKKILKMDKNIHIFCEKPLTSNLEEALLVKNLLKEKEVVLQVGHSERYHKIWDELFRYTEFLKGPKYIRLQRVAPFNERGQDVDVVQDLMIHDIDLVYYLFKEKVKSVNAYGHKVKTSKWDFVIANFECCSGSHVSLISSRCHTQQVRDLEVVSALGSLKIDLMTNQLRLAEVNQKGIFEYTLEKRDHLLEEQRDFYNSIKKKGPPKVGIDDALRAIHLVKLVQESLESRQRVMVDLI